MLAPAPIRAPAWITAPCAIDTPSATSAPASMYASIRAVSLSSAGRGERRGIHSLSLSLTVRSSSAIAVVVAEVIEGLGRPAALPTTRSAHRLGVVQALLEELLLGRVARQLERAGVFVARLGIAPE